MSKFNSGWIERNVYYRQKPGAQQNHFEQVMRPVIVCLCGSTRFYEAFQKANYEETMAGRIVLSVGHYPHSSEQAHGESIGCTPEQKIALDELHKRKIDLADEVLILNCKRPYCPKCDGWGKVFAGYGGSPDGRCIQCYAATEQRPYIGDSTRSELEYAKERGKTVRFLEPESTTAKEQ